MKRLLFLAFLAALGYGGYKLMDAATQGGKGPANPAVQLQQGEKAVDAANRAMGGEKVAAVQRAVNGFRDAEGRYPSSLQELVEKKYLESVPGGVTYDPATGTVSAG